MGKTGQRYKQKGYSPNHPVVIIPGLCSSAMKVVESPHKEWIDRRIWLDITTIGFGKVWDQMSIKKKKKKKKVTEVSTPTAKENAFHDSMQDIEEAIENGNGNIVVTKEEEKTKRRWIAHMVLQEDGVTDPVGIKLRPIETIHGIMYLDPGALTNALSYVFGPLIETLWDIGYTDANLRAAPYDWRIPPCFLESRDGYFLKLKEKVDDMFAVNEKKKVVIIGHSLGTRCSHYFLRYCERNFGRQWITDHIHTWIPVGPLFLGAPKSVRATVTGERMGLEAFLFEDEGILLSRGCGSSAWMFPYIVPDYDFTGYMYKKNSSGFWESHSIEEACLQSNVKNIWDGYRHNYHNDPCFGSQDDQLAAPPIDKLLAIYGINLKTEIFYFFKDAPADCLTKLTLDPTGEMDNYSCSGGIAYETKHTTQNKLRGKKRGGDGTVPYASLSYCTHWDKEIDVTIEELEGAEHREILKDKTFTRLIVEYNCHAPPPPELPNSFRDLVYDVLEIRDNKKAQRKITLTKKGIKVTNKGNNTLYHKKYNAIKSVIEQTNNTFDIQFVRSSSVYTYHSVRHREIVQELNVRIKFIEYARPSAEETIDEQGQTELHRAVKDKDIALVRELISDDRNINAQDNHGWTPLHIAANHSYSDIILLLLKQPKIEVNLQTKDLTVPLTYALRIQDEDCETIWNSFLAAGADLNSRGGTQDNSPLHEAIIRKNVRAVKWLIKEFANVNAKNRKGNSPLHFAVQHNDKDLIALLLENGADRHVQNSDRITPLNNAQKISTELLTFLRDYKVSGYCARASYQYVGESPQELSFDFGAKIINIKITSEYGDGWWYGECNGTKGYFPSNYVKVSEEIRDASRPALGAPEPEDGPNDIRDEYGQTQLHKAAFEDRCDIVFKLLMDDKTNINAQDRNGWTPAHCAAQKGSLEILLVLLQKPNIDLSKRNADGTTSLHYVARLKPNSQVEQKQLTQILDYYISSVDVDILGKGGETPLHQASLRGSAFVVKYLLEHDANANALNDSSAGPLFYAVGNRDLEITKLLLSYDANPSQKGKRGSPISIAVSNNSSSILQLLEENKISGMESEKIEKPPLPARKNEVAVRRPLRPLPNLPLGYGSFEDIGDSSEKQYSDDFESIAEGELFVQDVQATDAFDNVLANVFMGNMQNFEKEAFDYILKKNYNGDTNKMIASISSNTGKSLDSSSDSFVPRSPSKKKSSSSVLGSRPTTAAETAGSLLANKKKKNFFGRKK